MLKQSLQRTSFFSKVLSLVNILPIVVDLLSDLWIEGGGSKPKLRVWKLPQECPKFEEKFDIIQEHLAELCGKDELLTGVLSKAKGQILRAAAAAALHALFSIDPQHPRSEELSSMSIIAAINLIEVCNEHTTLIGGRKGITAPASCQFLDSMQSPIFSPSRKSVIVLLIPCRDTLMGFMKLYSPQ